MVVSWILMAVLLLIFIGAARGMTIVPGRLQNAVEFVYESFANFALDLGGEKARRYIGVFAAFFLFILIANWTDLLIFGDKVNWLRTPTSDINVTVGLALVAFVLFHLEGVRALGLRGYLGKFFNFSGFRHSIVDGSIDLFVGLIEFLLEFVKPVTLAFRLFGNLYGGGIMLGVFAALLLSIPVIQLFVALEAFIGFVQALIFAVLTLMFTMIAIEGHATEAHAAPAFADVPEGDVGPALTPTHATGANQ
ncbi:MAG TPA: F0F1 ATP synthase subunit A, partial [Candidatus Sulfotelmatobacter sp.]|nr:F0F1 ATP synthase subunit A [Candidatus Sulfotelmatobacter sp.]